MTRRRINVWKQQWEYQGLMSALTERKKREIETQFREMIAKRARKAFLTVYCDVKTVEDAISVPQKIIDSIVRIEGVESVSFTDSANVISVMAQWKESEVIQKIEQIKDIPRVASINSRTLIPRF